MGRKINKYPIEETITSGDNLLGSDELGATKQFPLDRVVDSVKDQLSGTNDGDWLLSGGPNGFQESFVRTDSTQASTFPVFTNYTDTTRRIDYGTTTGDATVIAVGNRVVLVNTGIRVLTNVETVGTNYFTVDEVFDTVTLTALEAPGTTATFYGDVTTVIQGDLSAPNVVSLLEDNTFTGVNTFSNPAGIQTDKIVAGTEIAIQANGLDLLNYGDTFNLGADIFSIGQGAPNTLIRGEGAVEVFIGAKDAPLVDLDNTFSTFTFGSIFHTNNPESKTFLLHGADGDDAIRYTGSTKTLAFEADAITGIPYSQVEGAPISLTAPQDTFVLGGTRSNVVTTDSNEFSTITIRNDFNSAPSQAALTTTSTGDVTISEANGVGFFRTGSQNREVVLTESDGTEHYGFFRTELASTYDINGWPANTSGTVSVSQTNANLSGTTAFGDFSIDLGVSGSLVLTGDVTGTIAVNDMLRLNSPFSQLVIDTISFNGTNTDITGTSIESTFAGSNGADFIYSLASDAIDLFTTAATYSYTPDLSGTVYSTSVSNQAFNVPGNDVTTNITDIANVISALETNITWDGSVRQANAPIIPSQTTSSGDTYTDTVGSNNFFFRDFNGVTQTFTDGSDWTSLEGLTFVQYNTSPVDGGNNTATSTSQANLNNYFIIILDGVAGASYNISNIVVDNALNGENTITLGTVNGFDLGSINGLTTDPSTVDGLFYYAVPSSEVTLDLGTTTDIDSSFTLTNGSNNQEGLLNQNGTVAGIGMSTTYTINDYDGMEHTSFTSSVSSNTESDIDFVGTQIAASVNNNVETPIDFTGTWDLATLTNVLTGTSAGTAGPWGLVVNNHGQVTDAGDIVLASSTSDDYVINEIETLISTGPATFTDTTGITTNNITDTFGNNVFTTRSQSGTYFSSLNAEGRLSLFSGDANIQLSGSTVLVNPGGDADFTVNGPGAFIGSPRFQYIYSTDTIIGRADNYEGIADQETGTWTPTFPNAGTQGTLDATYSKTGKTVVCHCSVPLAAPGGSSDMNAFYSLLADLPYTVDSASSVMGTFYTALSQGQSSKTYGNLSSNNTSLIFDLNGVLMTAGDLLGFLGFTVTYITTD